MRITDIYHARPRLTLEWATDVRRAVLEMLDGGVPAGQPIFILQLGDRHYEFPRVEGMDPAKQPPFLGWSPAAAEFLRTRGLMPEPGSLPIIGTVNGFDMAATTMLVTAQGAAGKTPAAHAIAELIAKDHPDGFYLARYGEPFTGYLKTVDKFGYEVLDAMFKHFVVVIDSFKDMLTDMSGAAMDSGLARRALTMLSRLSMSASELGVLVISPINPSSNKEAVVELLAEAARSNVGVAAVNVAGKWDLFSRVGEGRMRASGLAEIKFEQHESGIKIPVATVRAVATDGDDSEEITEATTAAFFHARSPEAIDGLLGTARRLANRN